MGTISARVIWKSGHYVGACATAVALHSERFTEGPKAAWLSSSSYCCGGDEAYKLTFSNPNDINALTGVFVAQDGVGYFLDGTVADVIAKSNGCCGVDATVTPIYNGVYPTIQLPVAKTYTVTRTDDNSLMAYDKFMVDYMKWIIDGTLTKTATGGTTTYVFQSYSDPIQQGNDTIVETARVFTSNTAPTLTGSNVFNLTGKLDNQSYTFKGQTTLAATVTALNADATLGPKGTWAVAGSTITLTTKVVDLGTIVIGQVAP